MTPAATTATPTKEQFRQQIDQTFRATAPNGEKFDLVLVDFKDVLDTDTQETFTLMFRAPTDTASDQGTYGVSNDAMGDQAIFLVPVSRDAAGLYFEAVYNRFKQ